MTNNKNIAFVFPGQGSQSVGMLTAYAGQYPEIRSTFDEASDILAYDLWELVQQGPDTELDSTAKTQPVLLAASVALWRIWHTQSNIKPILMAGHSLGEYTALVCAESLSFADAVQLVAERGKCMQSAVPLGTGKMAAILGMENEQVEEICNVAAQGQVVAAANFNSIGQIVIAGHAEAVERAVTAAKAAGAKRSVMLSVSVPSHCALMREAAQDFAQRLQKINFLSPKIPIIHNVDVTQKTESGLIYQALIEQLYLPVRWLETIQQMHAKGITHIVECGPGKVLSGLIKRIERNIHTLPISEPDLLKKAVQELTIEELV